ncbi:DUF1326 domain-containing protein [Streptomyces sp. NBC_01537]|uniref:DUF1326 domain-containing protein n=1 Tax=Streptomyces sp. NBC_01537 TaxID=2903896 RepID=UPI0038704025
MFHVADGNLGDLDLSGVDFAFYNQFPSTLTSGNRKVGLVVDTSASGAQADALKRILAGQWVDRFEQLSRFYGEFHDHRAFRCLRTALEPVCGAVAGYAPSTRLTFHPWTGPRR